MSRLLLVFLMEIFLCLAKPGESASRPRLFYRMKRQNWRPTRLEEGWISGSVRRCHVQVLNKYPDRHITVMYNKESKQCTPGHTIITDPSLPKVGEGVLYRGYSCRDFPGFSTFVSGSEEACAIYQATLMNFTLAKKSCMDTGGHLFVPKSEDKYKILWQVTKGAQTYPFIGLHRVSSAPNPKDWVWEWLDDGQQVVTSKISHWASGQPSDIQDDVCVGTFNYDLHDIRCYPDNESVCEIPL